MNQEALRRQYLDAMGIVTWASRFQLPNARETQACEWEEPVAESPAAPRERLQALLDDAPAPHVAPREKAPPSAKPARRTPSAIRQALGQEAKAATPEPAEKASTPTPAPRALAPSLRFTLSGLCIGGRWLCLQAGGGSAQEMALMRNMLVASGVPLSEVYGLAFSWPLIDNGAKVEEPLAEARAGVSAFLAGHQARHGWQIERLLWWGELDVEPFAELLQIEDSHSRTLNMPVWQGGALEAIAQSSEQKRELWPRLKALGASW